MSLLRASEPAELPLRRLLLRARVGAFTVLAVLSAGGGLTARAAWAVPAGAPLGTIVEYKLPSAVSTPSGIANGPDGNVWFTTEHGGMVGKIAPSGAVELFSVAPAASSLGGITTGPDGNIWFTDYTDARVGRLSPAGTNLALFPVAGTPGLAGITGGPDGNIWFSEAQASMLGRISPGGTGYTAFNTLTAGAWPHGLGSGPDGNVWFAEIKASKIGRITPSGGVSEWTLPTVKAEPRVITTGADGNLWFTEFAGNKIGRLAPTGAMTEFPVPTTASSPVGIAQGQDGYIWFTEQAGDKIGRISMSGVVSEFPLPTAAAQPDKIVLGADGNLWFTERTVNKIGTIVAGAPAGAGPKNTTAPTVSGVSAQGQALHATQGSWSGLPFPSVSYQWNRCDQAGVNCASIQGATGATYTLSAADVGMRVSVQVTAQNSSGTTSAYSTVSAVVAGPPVAASEVVSGAAVEGQTLTVVSGAWGGYPTPELSYQWLRCDQLGGNCVVIVGAIGNSYVLGASDVGGMLMVSVTGVNPSGTAVGSSPVTSVVNEPLEPPAPVAPIVIGSAAEGQTLTAVPGVWGGFPAPELSYQWLRCDQTGGACAPIAGATTGSYVVSAADVGGTLRVSATGTNTSGTATSASLQTAVVNGLSEPPAPAIPTVSGVAVEGQTLTAVPGAWGGYPAPELSYQWLRCDQLGGCTPIPGATSSIYALEPADIGEILEVVVTGVNPSGTAVSVPGASSVVSSLPTPAGRPTFTGVAAAGEALTAEPGVWGGYPAPELSYQWLRCDQLGKECAPIPGATGAGYVPQAADVGETLEVSVTGVNAGGTAMAASDVSSRVAGPPSSTVPLISGEAVEGQTLIVSPGAWGGYPPPVLSYQWFRCVQGENGCSQILGATGSTYSLGEADVGEALEVSVTGVNPSGTATRSSARTGVVAQRSEPPVSAVPTVSGAAVEGQTLTVLPGAWGGYPVPVLTYQWLRCDQTGGACAPIAGASTGSYVVSAADVGGTLRVSATGTNTSGATSAASGASAAVLSANGPLTGVLDSFNRANNAGPPSSSWTHAGVLNNTTKSNLYVIGNQATGASGTDTDFWNANSFGSNSEAFVTVAATPMANGDFVALGLRAQNPAASNMSAYQGFYVHGTSVPDEYKIVLRTNGTSDTALVSTAAGPRLASGDKLLFRAIGNTLELWVYDGGAWARVLSAKSTALPSGGYAILTARNSVVRLDDFGGGTLP